MAACRSAIERKMPLRMRWRVILEKKFSTALKGKGRGEVEGSSARMARQPSQHFGMFVGGIIIGDDVDRPVGDDFPLESVEKADEFARRCRCIAAADAP
jgi:hypothetical protein